MYNKGNLGEYYEDLVYGQDEKAKLERLVNEGAQVLQEIQDPTRRFERNCKSSIRRT